MAQGWGQYLSNYVTIPVVNKAVAGRSARSYTREGRFDDIASLVKSGDIVVVSSATTMVATQQPKPRTVEEIALGPATRRANPGPQAKSYTPTTIISRQLAQR